ncbi:MAG: peptidoglycan-binding protein [Verrucomicrobiales bacterium]|nr:peptidoglycan-binding protein [Verrucomicrobiales bacterium]
MHVTSGQNHSARGSQRGDARYWLIAILALAFIGWLWIQRPAPPVSPESLGSPVRVPTVSPDAPPRQPSVPVDPPKPILPAAVPPVLPVPKPVEPAPPVSVSTSAPPTAILAGPSSVPVPAAVKVGGGTNELAPGSAHPLGTVVIRSNRPVVATATNTSPLESVIPDPVGTGQVRSVLEAQLALARLGFSSGSIDGKLGSQTRSALRAFQEREGLPGTGNLDTTTRNRLALPAELFVTYTVTDADLGRLRPLAKTWMAKSEQDRMEYETILEMVSEKFRSHPALIRQLNPLVDWDRVTAGLPLKVPNVEPPPISGRLSFVRISLSAKTLQGFDGDSKLVLHFPCSIAKDKEKRPVGDLHVEKIAVNPNYTFNPDVFPESEEARQIKRKLILQPGPNNPVGVAWISLDRPGYGIHGTPQPEQVGRTESHGCFRLANWNAETLVKLVWIGMPIQVEP